MKNLVTAILFATLLTTACAKSGVPGSAGGSQPAEAGAKGGVDVGNMNGAIPQTFASMVVPNSWQSETKDQTLLINNANGSKIAARKSEITDLVSPTALSVQKYLKTKHPNRDYALFTVQRTYRRSRRIKKFRDGKVV